MFLLPRLQQTLTLERGNAILKEESHTSSDTRDMRRKQGSERVRERERERKREREGGREGERERESDVDGPHQTNQTIHSVHSSIN